LRLTWRHDEGEPSVPEPTGPFDIWALFPGGEPRPWPAVKRRWKALTKQERINAAAAVRAELDRKFGMDGGCLSDGAAMEAAAVVMHGRDVWTQYLRGSKVVWEQDTSDDGEDLLDLVQWWAASIP
jgi:hypothetical protein